MDLASLMRSVSRRRVIALPILLAGVAASAYFFLSLAPTYSAQAQLVFVPPNASVQSGKARDINPYLQFGSSIQTAANVALKQVNTPDFNERIRAAGVTSGVQVVIVQDSPVLVITSKTRDSGQAIRGAVVASDEIRREVRKSQIDAGSPESLLIDPRPIGSPAVSTVLFGARVKAALATLVLGVLAAINAAFLVDAVERRRRSRLTWEPTSGTSDDQLTKSEEGDYATALR
jgi:capsular polysaccharide biosynthesis protein